MERKIEVIFEENNDLKDIERRLEAFKNSVVSIGSAYYIDKIKNKKDRP